MRFSIRDLLWLTAAVALAATVYTDRIRMARQARQWAAEKAAVQRETAASIAEMRAKVAQMRTENLLQEYRFDLQLTAERQRFEREIELARAAATESALRLQQSSATAAAIELAAEARE